MRHPKPVDRIDTGFPTLHLRDPEHVKRVLAQVRGPVVGNIVTTCRLSINGAKVSEMALRLIGKHKPDEFKADASIHLGPGPCSATYLIFSSGRMVMTGVGHEGLVMAAAYRFVKYFIEKFQEPRCSISRCIITNMHAVFHMGCPISLDEIQRHYGRACYHKENIKCLVIKLRLLDPNTTTASPASAEGPIPNSVFGRLYESAGHEDEVMANQTEDKDKDEFDDHDDDDDTESIYLPEEPGAKRRRVRGVLHSLRENEPVYTSGLASSAAEAEHATTQWIQQQKKSKRKPKRKTAAKKVPSAAAVVPRKTKATPTISYNVWPTGAVVVQGGRSRQHIELAAKKGAEFLAQFTLHDSTRAYT